ncbi:L-seryl-tRNA(Sec) selenium transferase [Cedecea neteri]|uniref:L-seryl-tRNA(Sec) selenium transferase n=1 Tax=Cedecea neteri TaxID=158822 RepID=A0A2X2TDY8_9ENTR|nr:L-seryl-tRNA(Sec) selenium transferase [Cedecea neteri]
MVATLRMLQSEAREHIRTASKLPDWSEDWAKKTRDVLEASQRSALLPVFNLTGTVLHTNLGRALQAEAAIDASAKPCAPP